MQRNSKLSQNAQFAESKASAILASVSRVFAIRNSNFT